MSDGVLNPLNTQMRCGVFTNAQGQVFVVHDRNIPAPVDWAEYDESERKLFLILNDGVTQDLGVTINQKMHNNLMEGEEITLAKIVKGTFSAVQTVSLIVKDY